MFIGVSLSTGTSSTPCALQHSIVVGAWHVGFLSDVLKDTAARRPRPYAVNVERRKPVLSIIIVVVLLLWLVGLATSYTMGGILHLLLVVAIAAALLRLIEGRNPVRG